MRRRSGDPRASLRHRAAAFRCASVAALGGSAALAASLTSCAVCPSLRTFSAGWRPRRHGVVPLGLGQRCGLYAPDRGGGGLTTRAADADGCLCKFGVIGDIQYADMDDGTDVLGIKPRYFRHTLDILRGSTSRWRAEGDIAFVAQLGDLVDGRNAPAGQSNTALATVLSEFPSELPRVDLVGNHELYNWQREELFRSGLCLQGEGLPALADDAGAKAVPGLCCSCFGVDGEAGRWEVICLDAYDVACIGYPEGHPMRVEAESILAQLNPQVFVPGVDWFHGVPEQLHRYVPYNGAMGAAQLDWLRGRLAACMEAGRKAIVLTHIPILEASTTPKTVLWNAEEVLQILRGEDGRCVVAVLAGHDHDAGYAVDPGSGIHHVTFLSPLICAEGSGYSGAATVECYEDHIELVGHGVFCVESGTQARGQPYSHLSLRRVDPRGW